MRGRSTSDGSTWRWSRSDWWGVVLEAPDARALARFYADLLGWEVATSEPDHAAIGPSDGVAYLAFQTSPDYVRPVWPSDAGSQQLMMHLDFQVSDLEAAIAHAVELGAQEAQHQPQRDVRVLLDPAGHPFCLYLDDVPPAPRQVGEETSAEVSQASPGQIILLNGTSSSGKSSIAAELLLLLEDDYFLMSVDVFNAMRIQRDDPKQLEVVLRRTRAGFHRAVAGMAAAGNNVVVDHVLSEPWRLDDCLSLFAGFDVVFVGVRCDLEAVEHRERERGDRPAGLAALQAEQVHSHGIYDVECDTTTTAASDCAIQIRDFLREPKGQRAFDQLRRAGGE